MKRNKSARNKRSQWRWTSWFGACLATTSLSAAETNAPAAKAPEPPTPEQMFEGGANPYNNWLELSTGGALTSGSQAQFQQRQRRQNDGFGGISDFHYQRDVAKDTTLTAEGHALFDENDYKLNLKVGRDNLGYVRVTFDQFRTWSNGAGGFYPPAGMWYPLSENALALDRGEISFEAGLTLENKPKVVFKYTHAYREGEKGSTIWGLAHPDVGVTRGLSPSFYDLSERSDSFQLDVTHHIKTTDFGVGMRYETGSLDNALKITQGPGEPGEQKITNREGTSYDLFNVHAFTETWLKKNLFFSTAYSFTDLNNDFSGSRIYGNDFDVGYVPAIQSGSGYSSSTGTAHVHEYVTDLNMMYKPTPHFSITPSLRVMKEDTDANSAGTETRGLNTAPFSDTSEQCLLDVRERLDLTYNGITNWVFFARGEWTEGSGNLTANGGLGSPALFGGGPIQQQTDDERFFQKYSAGARWYASRRATLDFGGYYKINDYNYTHNVDSTLNGSANRYPAYLVMQDFETYDGNVRLTLRPWRNVTLVSRYEYQLSTINTKPDAISGLGSVESAQMTSHILAQDVSWSPWSRLCLQVGFNYVLSETKTPAADYTQAILNAQNNYWTLSFNSGLILDDKTDLNLGYTYYRADNYSDNATVGVPYGAGAEEHGITATLVRRLSESLRLTLKYGYYRFSDAPSGGHNDYSAHILYSSLQYRF